MGYPGSDATNESLTVEAPFKPILPRWKALRKVVAKLYKTGTIAYGKLDLVFSRTPV